MAFHLRARAIAGCFSVLLGGLLSAPIAADVPLGQSVIEHNLPAEAPLVVALADANPAALAPAATKADVAVTAPQMASAPAIAAVDAAVPLPPVRERQKISSLGIAPAPVTRRSAPAVPAPAQFFTINQVLAKHKAQANGSSTRQLAALEPAATANDGAPVAAPARGDEPFGLFTFRAPDGLLWTKWRNVETEMRAEAPVLATCRADHDRCTPAAARFNAIVDAAKTQQGRARLTLVNERINDAIHYTSDYVQFGVADRWSAPLASLASGLGDCEDYAIAKYAALRAAGLPDHDLHVLLVRDNSVHLDHAVLAVREGAHWLILDNRWSRLTLDSELHQCAPLFALDEQGVKLFAAPYAAAGAPPNGDTFIAGADLGVLPPEKSAKDDLRVSLHAATPALP